MPLAASPPAESPGTAEYVAKYHDLVKKVADLEKIGKGADLRSVSAQLRSAYRNLLEQYPLLEGFWVRFAHFEFRVSNFTAGAAVFREALKIFPLSASITVQTEYLRFLLRLGNLPQRELRDEFVNAAKIIGQYFLAHEFWDLYLEIADEPAAMLIYILDHCTLHQFAKYYAQLRTILDTEGVAKFTELLSLTETTSQDEEALVKEVVLSKLQLKYELHSRRVNQVWQHFQRIKRPFFHPKPNAESAQWLEYARSSPIAHLVLPQALVPCYFSSEVWLAYLRLGYRKGFSVEEQRRIYEAGICSGSEEVRLHYALWLELHQDLERAKQIYELVTSDPGRAQKLQFHHRINGTVPTPAPTPIVEKASPVLDDEVYTEADLVEPW